MTDAAEVHAQALVLCAEAEAALARLRPVVNRMYTHVSTTALDLAVRCAQQTTSEIALMLHGKVLSKGGETWGL